MTCTTTASTTTIHAESQPKQPSNIQQSTNPSTPICGAKTRLGTACKNTLVTGCGRCPIHAAHLRVAHATFKQRPKSRRKKFISQTYCPSQQQSFTVDHIIDQPFLSNFSRIITENHSSFIRDTTPPPTSSSSRMQSLDSLHLMYQQSEQSQVLPLVSAQQTYPSPCRAIETPLIQNLHQSGVLEEDLTIYPPLVKGEEIAIGTPVTPNPDFDENVGLYCGDGVDEKFNDTNDSVHLHSPHRMTFDAEFSDVFSPRYKFEQSLD